MDNRENPCQAGGLPANSTLSAIIQAQPPILVIPRRFFQPCFSRFILTLALSFSAISWLVAEYEYSLENGYISLQGSGGTFSSLRLAPQGNGDFGENLIREWLIGVPNLGGLAERSYEVERSASQVRLRDLTVYLPEVIDRNSGGYPREILPGQRVGVAFHAQTGFDRVGARFPTWHQRDSAATATLYRLPRLPFHNETVVPGEKLGEIRLENIVDNQWADMSFGMFPPGHYLVELSNISNHVGWWGQKGNLYTDLIPVEDRRANGNLELSLRIRGVEAYSGDWTLSLDGNKVESRFTGATGTPAAAVHNRLISPWDNSGYSLDAFPFKSFHGSTGQFLLPHQLKRRTIMPQARRVSWMHALGKDDRDLRFDLFGSHGFVWEMEQDSLHWVLSDGRLDLTALRAEGLPSSFPRFFSSDPELTDLLTDFLLGHGFNLGAGAGVEWKEWQSLILGWTDNVAKRGVGNQLLAYRMTPEGYVYTWGNTIGWPFPFKDQDGDGLNDWDTRHFTTNSNMISAISRHVAWTRDSSYLQQALPRARLAMEYQLGPLQGANGLLIGNSVHQTGRNGAFGSNYWDLLPFGHKDAFANVYFYNSLARMAELEEMAEILLTPAQLEAIATPGQAPGFYRHLMETAKQRFTETFWDEAAGRFIGCIDVDGVPRDYGFTFINLEALAYGLGSEQQAARIFDWLEHQPTSSGEADTYTRWIFAPRATTIQNPPNFAPQTPRPTWRYSGWGGTPWETQVQDGGTILYISGYDLLARSRFLGAENVDQRMREIVDRYAKPDRLMGGSPLYFGEQSQGGPGGTAGAVGVEGEFPESGLAPAAFLRTVLGIEAKPDGLHVKPNLPASLEYAGVENVAYAGELWRVTVTRDRVMVDPVTGDQGVIGSYSEEEPFVFRPWFGAVAPRPLLEDTFELGEPGTEIAGKPTSDGHAIWEADGMPGENVHLRYDESDGGVVFAPFSGSGRASVYLDHDVDGRHAYAIHFGRVTLRGYSFGSNLMLAARKGEGDLLRHGYELRPHGGTPESGPDFWALWFRPADGRDIPVRNITGSTVTLDNLELRVSGGSQRLYQNGVALDPLWRPTQNRPGDAQPDRALQITLNTSPDADSFTHPVFQNLRLVELGLPRRSQSPLIAYEGLEYEAGDLIGRDGGVGWSGPFLQVGSRPSPVLEPTGMDFSELQRSGGSLFGESNASASRYIATGDLHPDRLDPHGRLGKPGTQAWISFLGQAVGPITNRLWSFSLYRDISQVLYLGKAFNERATWRLSTFLVSGATGHAFTGVPYTEAGLWVLRLDFSDDGNHSVHVFRNPEPSGEEPSLSTAVASFNRTDLSFDRIRINAGDGLRIDEIRIGSTWDSVTPVTSEGYPAWRKARFSEAELADESISGDAADPHGEGIPNLLRYALGLDELEGYSRNHLPQASVTEAEGDAFLSIAIQRPAGRDDVVLEVLASGDLHAWQDSAILLREETQADGSRIEHYRDLRPLHESSRRFLRVMVRRAE